jgi:hypothetical protein
MPDLSASVELVRREASEALERPLPPMSDGEVAAAYRTAKALADSGMFKDARQPGQAFAKMLAGRDLGLTPFESMSALHVIEGKIEASADLHATRVRAREGYDYRVWWLRVADEWNGQPDERGRLVPPRDLVEAVPSEEEDPADLRDYYGCVIEFTVGGERRGVARWTLEDSRVAMLLDKAGPGGGPGNHRKFPRSMYFARAMSQGVTLHVPEVMGGLRVYAPGELPREGGPDLAAGDGAAPTMDDLPTAVEAVLARARELGHAGLASRESAVMAVRGRSAEDVARWVRTATKVLNAAARGAEPEPPDAEVVPERCGVEFGAGVDGDPRPARCELPKGHDGPHTGPMVTPSENEAVSAPPEGEGSAPMGEASAAPEAQPEPHEADESAEVVDGEVAAESVAVLDARMSALRALIHEAEENDPVGERVTALREELDAVEAQRAAAADPGQGSLGV